MALGELEEMSVRRLSRGLDPRGKMVRADRVREHPHMHPLLPLEAAE